MRSNLDHNQSLSFERRLHHNWEYRRFFTGSEVYKLGPCIIFRIPNELGHFRLGITLKARGTSVERNKVKRQIREEMRRHATDLGSFDYNVVVPGAHKLSWELAARVGDVIKIEFKKRLHSRV